MHGVIEQHLFSLNTNRRFIVHHVVRTVVRTRCGHMDITCVMQIGKVSIRRSVVRRCMSVLTVLLFTGEMACLRGDNRLFARVFE